MDPGIYSSRKSSCHHYVQSLVVEKILAAPSHERSNKMSKLYSPKGNGRKAS